MLVLSFCTSSPSVNTTKELDSLRGEKLYTSLTTENHLTESGTATFTGTANAQSQTVHFKLMLRLNESFHLDDKLKFGKFTWQSGLRQELEFLYFPDSLFYKTTDLFKYNLLLSGNSNKHFNHSLHLDLQSPLLPGYENSSLGKKGVAPVRNSSFFNPASVDISCGLNYDLGDKNYCHLGLMSARIFTQPDKELLFPVNGGRSTLRTTWHSDYGYSVNLRLNKKWKSILDWDQTASLFMQSTSTNTYVLDIQNSLAFHFGKYAIVRSETKLKLNPPLSKRRTIDQDVSLGLSFAW